MRNPLEFWSNSTWKVRDLMAACCLLAAFGVLVESETSGWLSDSSPSFLGRAMHVNILLKFWTKKKSWWCKKETECMAKRGRFSLRIWQIWPQSKSKLEELGSVTWRMLQGAENEAPRVLLQLFLPRDLKLRYQKDSIAVKIKNAWRMITNKKKIELGLNNWKNQEEPSHQPSHSEFSESELMVMVVMTDE